VGSFIDPDERDKRSHLQHNSLWRGHAHDLEAGERPRQELAPRLQVTGSARLPDQKRKRKSGPAVQGTHCPDPDSQGLSIHRGNLRITPAYRFLPFFNC